MFVEEIRGRLCLGEGMTDPVEEQGAVSGPVIRVRRKTGCDGGSQSIVFVYNGLGFVCFCVAYI